MRQLRLTVPTGSKGELDELLDRHDARAVRMWEVDGGEGDEPVELCAEMVLTNRGIGDFLEELDRLGEARVTLLPQDVLTLVPGREAAPEDLVDVEPLSPPEVYLAGLQSVGSWTGFLGYAAIAGAVVWIGMLVNSIFLLIAAMLIAPFAGPAMNTALASAAGDVRLFRRTLVRYVAAIVTVVGVVAAFHALLGTDIATNTMTETANISSVAAILPLVAGAAGALNLMQSERSSLVSGAATGVLVAAALAPPAGLVGMALVLREWSMVGSGAFLLALQLAGLNLSGALVFRAYGIKPDSARYQRGTRPVSWAAIVGSLLVVAGLVTVQLWNRPSLQRSSVQTEIAAELSQLIKADPQAELVEVQAGFTRPDIPGQDTLLGVIYVQPKEGVELSALEERLGRELSRTISDRYEVVALITVTAISPP